MTRRPRLLLLISHFPPWPLAPLWCLTLLGSVRTTRNFVWFAKKICQREAIFSANDFLHPPKFLLALRNFKDFVDELLEAVKILSGEKILCSLPSIRHRVINFRSEASVNRRMTLLPFTYFYRTRYQENGASGVGFRTKILLGEEVPSTGENDCDGGVFSVELKPPKSITGES